MAKVDSEEQVMLAGEIEDSLDEAEMGLQQAIECLQAAGKLFDDAGMSQIRSAMDGYIIPHLQSWIDDENQCGGLQDARGKLAKLKGDACHICERALDGGGRKIDYEEDGTSLRVKVCAECFLHYGD